MHLSWRQETSSILGRCIFWNSQQCFHKILLAANYIGIGSAKCANKNKRISMIVGCTTLWVSPCDQRLWEVLYMTQVSFSFHSILLIQQRHHKTSVKGVLRVLVVEVPRKYHSPSQGQLQFQSPREWPAQDCREGVKISRMRMQGPDNSNQMLFLPWLSWQYVQIKRIIHVWFFDPVCF